MLPTLPDRSTPRPYSRSRGAHRKDTCQSTPTGVGDSTGAKRSQQGSAAAAAAAAPATAAGARAGAGARVGTGIAAGAGTGLSSLLSTPAATALARRVFARLATIYEPVRPSPTCFDLSRHALLYRCVKGHTACLFSPHSVRACILRQTFQPLRGRGIGGTSLAMVCQDCSSFMGTHESCVSWRVAHQAILLVRCKPSELFNSPRRLDGPAVLGPHATKCRSGRVMPRPAAPHMFSAVRAAFHVHLAPRRAQVARRSSHRVYAHFVPR